MWHIKFRKVLGSLLLFAIVAAAMICASSTDLFATSPDELQKTSTTDPTITTKAPSDTPRSVGPPQTTIVLEGSLQKSESTIKSQARPDQNQVNHLSLGLNFQPNREFEIYAEAVLEQQTQETEFLVERAFVSLPLISGSELNLKLGQMFYPLGHLADQDRLFSFRPAFQTALMGYGRGLDLGGTISYAPTPRYPLTFSYSVFSGQTLHNEDQYLQSPEHRPRVLSAAWQDRQWDLFASYASGELSNSDQRDAFGVGTSSELYFLSGSIGIRTLAEAWTVNTRDRRRITEKSLGYFVYPELNWKWMYLGYYFGVWNRDLLQGQSLQQNTRIVKLGAKLHTMVRLETEWGQEWQDFKPKRLLTRDEFSIRIKFKVPGI